VLDWCDEIRARFPDWGSEAAALRWPEVRGKLAVGQAVAGVVVARAPFGVWLDIGVGHPALLRVPEMERARERRLTFADYPAIGAALRARVIWISDSQCEISLTQRDLEGINE
jgi:hypothetical protein